MSVRHELRELLAGRWAGHDDLAPVAVLSTVRALGELRGPTVLLRQKRIGRAPEAPTSYWAVSVLLTVVSPHLDLDRAADQLDVLVPAILADLDDAGIKHDAAEEVAYADRLAYDIPLDLYSPKEKTP